jgi:hypothetical protein
VSLEPTTSAGELDRTCPECGTGFTVDSAASRRKYCSPSCCEKGCAHLPKPRVCPQCDKEFDTNVSGKRKFSSAECLVAFRRSEEQQEACLCPVCDNPFQAAKTVRTVYCSMACRQEAERVRDRALDEERDRRLAQTTPPVPAARVELPPTSATGPREHAAAGTRPGPAGADRDTELFALPMADHDCRAAGHARSRPADHAPPPHRYRPTATDSLNGQGRPLRRRLNWLDH